MRTIYKYPLQSAQWQTIDMPIGARLLAVQVQDGIPMLWALVDTDNDHLGRIITIYPTGGKAPSHLERYIDTFQLFNGTLVYHVFDATAMEETVVLRA